jgi:hypothetical protein
MHQRSEVHMPGYTFTCSSFCNASIASLSLLCQASVTAAKHWCITASRCLLLLLLLLTTPLLSLHAHITATLHTAASHTQINTAPAYCTPLTLHPPGLRVSRYLYSPHQKRLVQCTLIVHDAASACAVGIEIEVDDAAAAGAGAASDAPPADTGPLFQVTVDCEPVDAQAGLGDEALAALREQVSVERARVLQEEEENDNYEDSSSYAQACNALTAAETALEEAELERSTPPSVAHYISDSLADVWRRTRVALGVLTTLEGTDELRAEAEVAIEAGVLCREPPDAEEIELRRRVGQAVLLRADLRRCTEENLRALAARRFEEPPVHHRARHSAEAAALAVQQRQRGLPPSLRHAGTTASANGRGSSSLQTPEELVAAAAAEETALVAAGLFSGAPFHCLALDRLLEALPGADACEQYVFLEHRPSGGWRAASQPLSAAVAAAAARPEGAVAACLARAWEEQAVEAAADRRQRERTMKRKRADAERARSKRAKDAEQRSHKEVSHHHPLTS